MNTTISAVVAPLVERKVFDTEEEAVRSLLGEYILGQIEKLRQDTTRFEQKYGMRFEQFAAYVHER
jgi:hypothetical protein